MTKQEATNDNLELKYLESQIALCTMVRQFMHTYRKEDGTPYFYTAYQTAGEWAFSVLNFTDAFVSFEEFYTKYDELCTKLSELNGLPKSSVSRLELYHEEERNGKIVCDNEREWD